MIKDHKRGRSFPLPFVLFAENVPGLRGRLAFVKKGEYDGAENIKRYFGGSP